MNDIEQELQSLLKRRSQALRVRGLLTPRTLRRVRLLQAGTMASVAGMVAGLITIGVVGMNTVFPGSTDVAGVEGRSVPSERIYVYDAFGEERATPRILALETAGGQRTFSEAYDVPGGTGMAPSPDGLLLYIVRVTGADGSFEGVLETLDTATGRVVHSASFTHPFSTSSGSSISPSVSPEGRWVYVLRVSPDGRDYSLLTYDSIEGSFAPRVLGLNGCRPVGLLPSPTERRIHILCNQSHEVWTVDFLTSGEPQAVQRLALPNVEDSTEDSFGNNERLGGVSSGALSLDGDFVYAVTSNGHVFTIDAASNELVGQRRIPMSSDEVVADVEVGRENLYAGLGGLNSGDVSISRRLLQVELGSSNSTTVKEIGQLSDFVFGPGAEELTGLDGENRRLVVIDAESGALTSTVEGVGSHPAFLRVP